MANFVFTFVLVWYGIRYNIPEVVIAGAIFSLAFQISCVASAIRRMLNLRLNKSTVDSKNK